MEIFCLNDCICSTESSLKWKTHKLNFILLFNKLNPFGNLHVMYFFNFLFFFSVGVLEKINKNLLIFIWKLNEFIRWLLWIYSVVTGICNPRVIVRKSIYPNTSHEPMWHKVNFWWSFKSLIESFPSSREVAIPRLKSPICPTIYPQHVIGHMNNFFDKIRFKPNNRKEIV